MARGAWLATVYGVAKSQTQLTDSHTHTHTHILVRETDDKQVNKNIINLKFCNSCLEEKQTSAKF